MRFTKVRLVGGQNIDLPVAGAKLTDEFILKAIDGLGPPEVAVHISEIATEGGFYQGRRPHSREIVVRIALNPNYFAGESHSDLRSKIYGLLSTGNTSGSVLIQLLDEFGLVAVTTGWVKKLETVMFTKDPEVQITFATDDPYLLHPESIILENQSSLYFQTTNPGSVDVGFRMELTFLSAYGLIGVAVNDTDFDMVIGDFVWGGFLIDDEMVIDTTYGNREIYIMRAGVRMNLLHLLNVGAVWSQLVPGINTIYLNPAAIVSVDKFSYTPKYWGA